jgi:transcriptional regulator with XRE-family HTH domain
MITDPIDVEIAAKLRALRKERGLSQTALGAAAGVTFQQIQKYETGANRVSASRLYKLAKALDTPVADFFPS